jgi:Fur family ferric uptake transcriptional regulator
VKRLWFMGNEKNAASPGNQGVSAPPCGAGGSVDNLHKKEKDELFKLLAQTGEALPAGGEEALECFLRTEGHISPKYLKAELEKAGCQIDLSTVVSVLEVLCRYGIAQKVLLNGEGSFYEHLHLGAEHDHLLCTRCGRVLEPKDPDLKERVQEMALSHGFQPLLCRVTILGLCERCRRREEPSMPLSMAARGEKLRIVRLAGGCQMQNRLTAMGLMVGDEIEVLNNSGPFILSAKGTRLAVGLGLAKKIMVSIVR